MNVLKSIQKDFFQSLRIPLPERITRLTTPALSSSTLLRHRSGKAILSRMKDGPRVNRLERMEIYHRQYWFRILDSLREDFVMTEFILGKRCYQKLTEQYLREHPSSHWTLRALGRDFPGFLRKHRDIPAAPKCVSADMAALEWAMIEVFEGPEARRSLDGNTLDIAVTILKLSKTLRFVRSEYDLDKIRKSYHARGKLRADHLRRGKASVFCVFRMGLDIHVKKLNWVEWTCLRKFSKGSTIENALKGTKASPETVFEWFSNWSSHRWLEHEFKQ